MIGIYIITNLLNGKSYVGSSRNIEERFRRHRHPANNTKLQIQKDILKYGVDNFVFVVLLECPEDMLDVWERDMINLFNTYEDGYNESPGGEKGSFQNKNSYSVEYIKKHNHSYYLTHKEKCKENANKQRQTPQNKLYQQNYQQKYKKGDKYQDYLKKVRGLFEPLTKSGKPKPKWRTPEGEIVYMTMKGVKQYHPDWILIKDSK